MSMALPDKQPRSPYKMENGLMRCETCPCVYSRGGWHRAKDTSKGTETPSYVSRGEIPDNVCPFCKTKEEEATHDNK